MQALKCPLDICLLQFLQERGISPSFALRYAASCGVLDPKGIKDKIVFPAWAGVILGPLMSVGGNVGVPRMGGGDPNTLAITKLIEKCSPHGRG